jgi:hypothetical protein
MPIFLLFLLFFISVPCFGQTAHESADQLWEVGDRRWTVEEEQRFGKWVEETVTEDFFLRYNLPTDCADAVYGIRWIYARIIHLPAAATTLDGKWIGHWSTDWKELPTDPDWEKDERFRAALLFLFSKTWTGTLPRDTYPVRISPDSVTPGTLFLVSESHTGIIGRVFCDGSHVHPLQTWESGLPKKVQKLGLRYFFSTRPEAKAGSGIVKFRWPVFDGGEWKYLPAKEHPFYSVEQYAPGFCEGHADFIEAVAKKMDLTNDPPVEKLDKAMGTIVRYLKERIPIVQEGYRQCGNGGCPEGSEWWEIHQTRSRDETLMTMMDHLDRIIASNRFDREAVKKKMESIPVAISEDRSITFFQVYQNHPWLSSRPEDSIETRWGLNKCRMIRSEVRAANDSIAFIDKKYRKKDPKYADFSIRQQKSILQKLLNEWTGSECPESVPAPAPVKIVSFSPPPKNPIKSFRPAKKCSKIEEEIRAAGDSIAFIEKTYRKKDPDYSDFSIRQQQRLLRYLNEEWTAADCGETPPVPLETGK